MKVTLHRRVLSIFCAVLAACAAATPSQAQQPAAAELFFSEYVEGSSNNKALEIYNGTTAPVDLVAGGYNVQMFFNGNASAGLTINLTGTVAAGGVYIVAHSSAVLPIVPNQTNGSGWFNGNDVVVLRKGVSVVDVIGQFGLPAPTTEWGSGLTSTADNTLRRKCDVAGGDPNGSDAFDPSIEWDGFASNTFDGLGEHCLSAPPPPPVVAAIHEIQGSGLASPYAGQSVETLGNIVTAVDTNGFFIQAPASAVDADPLTSEGVFVFTSSAPTVQIGDVVNVTGTVSEFFELTEIANATVVKTGSDGIPAPVILDEATPSPFATSTAAELERYEGMLVRVENAVATGPTDRFGDTPVVARAARAFREAGILFPGLPGLPVWDGNPEIFEVTFSALGLGGLSVPSGTPILYAEGPLSFAFGDYQIWPTSFEAGTAPELPRPVRAARAGEFAVGSQNLLRFFDDDPDEYADRLVKASLHIRTVLGAPDVVAVQEVENLTVLQDLAVRIAGDDASIQYTAYLLEGNDIGGIDVGFLVRDTVDVDSVEQFGRDEIFPLDGSLLNDRPPLVLRGSYVGNGEPFPFVLINVHQRSLSGIEGTSSGAQRVRAKRFQQALRLSELIQDLQTTNAAVRLIAAGDFNAFEFTDGYVDVMGQVTGVLDPAGALIPGEDIVNPDLVNQTFEMPAAERYSFVFDGSAQSLDHVLTSQALGAFTRGAEHSRGNADAPASFAADPATPLRVADHDGTVLFVMTDFDGDGRADDLDNCRTDPNADQLDTDGDGVGNACDAPSDKDECKDGGWRTFSTIAFPNQGQCVSFVESRRPRP